MKDCIIYFLVFVLSFPNVAFGFSFDAPISQIPPTVPLVGIPSVVVPLIFPENYAHTHIHGEGVYTIAKGTIGENVMRAMFSKHTEINLNMATFRRQGIDFFGVRLKNNLPSSPIAAEAKLNSSFLGTTKAGVQMSPEWISKGFKDGAQNFSNLSKEILSENCKASLRAPSPNDVSLGELPMGNGRKVLIWRNESTRQLHYFSKDSITPSEISSKLNSFSKYIQALADGKISYRPILCRVVIQPNDILIFLKNLDTDLNSVVKVSQLPLALQAHIRDRLASQLAGIFSKNKNAPLSADDIVDAGKLLDQAKANGKLDVFVNNLRTYPKWSPLFGLKTSLKSGVLGGVLSGGLDLFSQYISGEKINYLKSAKMTVLGATSTTIGVWSGSNVSYALMTPTAQNILKQASSTVLKNSLSQTSLNTISRFGGGIAGGFVTSVLFSYGLYALGYSDLTTAKRNMAAGAVSTVAYVGVGYALGIGGGATAAATTGGAAAATGGLLAGGAVATGGLILIAFAAGAGVMYLYTIKDAIADNNRVENLIKSVKSNLK